MAWITDASSTISTIGISAGSGNHSRGDKDRHPQSQDGIGVVLSRIGVRFPGCT